MIALIVGGLVAAACIPLADIRHTIRAADQPRHQGATEDTAPLGELRQTEPYRWPAGTGPDSGHQLITVPVCPGSGALAAHIEGGRLPLPGYVGLHVAVGSRPDLDRWASALGAEVRVSGGRPAVHVYGGGLSVHVRGPRGETAAGDAGPSAVAGSEVTDSGPATTTAAGDGDAPADAPGETVTSPVARAGAAPGTPTGGSGVPGVTPDEPAGGAR